MNRDLRNHVIKTLDAGVRSDGRKALEFRQPMSVEYGVTTTAEGSARVIIGETEVMVGVKVELGRPYPDSPNQGTMMVGAELLPMSSPEFESGPPSIQAIELARVVDRGIRESKSIDFKKLCIEPGEKVWTLIIDIISINDAGNLFDAASLGALAALKDFRFPNLDEDGNVVHKIKGDKVLEFEGEPIEVTVLKIGKHFVVDPTSNEEQAVDARLTVAVLANGELCAMQKGGETPLNQEEIMKMVDIAIEKTNELRVLLK
jgi:exosome complex component RRP42